MEESQQRAPEGASASKSRYQHHHQELVDDECSTDSGCSSGGSTGSAETISQRGSGEGLDGSGARSVRYLLDEDEEDVDDEEDEEAEADGGRKGERSSSRHHHHHHHLHGHRHNHHVHFRSRSTGNAGLPSAGLHHPPRPIIVKDKAHRSWSPQEAHCKCRVSIRSPSPTDREQARPSKRPSNAARTLRKALESLKLHHHSHHSHAGSCPKGKAQLSRPPGLEQHQHHQQPPSLLQQQKRILRSPVTYTYVRGLSGLPTQRVPRSAV